MAVVKLYSLARMSTATAGTGTLTLGSAISAFLSFANAGVSDGETVRYAIKDGSSSEIGYGVYTASGTTLTRNVLKSTNSNNPITLSGSAEVFITAAAEDFMQVAGWDAGTVSAPAIFPAGDTNTGWWFPAADTAALSTAGAERVRYHSTALVSFHGATNPAFKIDGTAASAATGLAVAAAAAAAGVSLSAISSGTDENFKIDAKGAGTLTLNSVATGAIALARVTSILAGSASAPAIYPTGDTNTGLWAPAADTLALSTGGTERVRVDSSGVVVIGHTAALTSKVAASSVTPQFQVTGLTAATSSHLINRFSADASGPSTYYAKSRGATAGDYAIVQSGDILGRLTWGGANGTDITEAAQIRVEVDGTPGAADMPGRILFLTTADGATAPTERMRIDSSGRVLVGHTAALANTVAASSITPLSQVTGTDGSSGAKSVNRFSNDVGGAAIYLAKSRSGTIGTYTVVQSGDTMGLLSFGGADGTDISEGARIAGQVDGTPGAGDMPGRLVFFTSADGSEAPTERMRIDSSGNVLAGHTAALVTKLATAATTPRAQVTALDSAASQLISRFSADTAAPSLFFGKSRGATAGDYTVVNSGDIIGQISWGGADGTDISEGARIRVVVDATPGAGDMPCYMAFMTSADGSESPTERMRITSAGLVGINTGATIAAQLSIFGTGTAIGIVGGEGGVSDQLLQISGPVGGFSGNGGGSIMLFSNDTLGADLGGIIALGGKYSGNNVATFGRIVAGKDNATTGEFGGYLAFQSRANGFAPAEHLRICSTGNIKLSGSALRGTTEGTNHLDIFDGTAPVGTLANGCSFYSTSGEMRVMDAAGNATLLSPHDSETNEWIYHSVDTRTGKGLRIDMERLMRKLDELFGGGFVREFVQAA